MTLTTILSVVLDWPILDLGQRVPCAYPIIDLNLCFFKNWEVKKKIPPKFHLTFKISLKTQQIDKLLIENFLKEWSNPQFCPSYDFMDNFNVQ